jgi:carboxypeptidase Q
LFFYSTRTRAPPELLFTSPLPPPPLFLLLSAGDYFFFHHTAADTVDKLDPAQMDRCALLWAVYTFVVADLDAMLPRV